MSIAFRDLPVYDLQGATRNFEQLTSASFPPEGKAGGSLAGEYPNPTLAKQEAFKAASFEHSWVNFEEGFTKAGYMKDLLGFVHVRGLIKSGELGKSAFILAAGFRPKAIEQFITQDGAGTIQPIRINTAGEVIPETGNNASIRLTGITFSVE